METVPLARKTHPLILVAAASVTALSVAGIATLAGWMPARSGEAPAITAPLAAAPAAQAATAQPQVPAPASAAARIEAPATLQIPAGSTITVEPKRQASAPRPVARSAPVVSRESVRDSAPRAVRTATQPVNDNGIYVEDARPAQLPAPTQAQTPAQPQYGTQSPSQYGAPATCADCGTVESVREISNKGEGSGLGAVAGGVLGGLLGSQVGGGNGKKVMAVVGAAGGAFAGHEVEKRMRGQTVYEVTVRYDDGRTRTFTETQPTQLQSGDRVRVSNGRIGTL